MNPFDEHVADALRQIRMHSPLEPRAAIILGSGLNSVANLVDAESRFATANIPHSPTSTVPGHAGELILGRLGKVEVAVLSGRVHAYEGYSAAQVAFLTRVVHGLGAKTLLVTNAAGALNPAFHPGDVMALTDHISFPSLSGRSPLVGPAAPGAGPRFVDLTDAYSMRLRNWARDAANQERVTLWEGVYVMVGGPNFETPAEVRLLRLIGGDAVGMSTVPEVIVARQMGMDVLGLSVISNFAAGLPGARLAHEEVLQCVADAAPSVARLIESVVARLA